MIKKTDKNIEVIKMSDKPSFIARIIERLLKLNKPQYMDSKDKVIEFLDEKSEEDNQSVKSFFKCFDFNGKQIFKFGDENRKNLIVYIHGGAYVNQINIQHFLFCKLMSVIMDSYVLAPVYPLAPLHKSSETLEFITQLYEKLIKEEYNITLMGDSAGGGFVLSFCQYLNQINLPQPDNIVTFSPWVDISMSNPPYDNENDPILGEVGLKEIGKSWAGNLNIKDYRVSPIYGNNNNLSKTLIFAGENEIFFKDIEKYVDNLKRDNVKVKFVVGNKLFHIYPLFPIPELISTLKIIKKEMK